MISTRENVNMRFYGQRVPARGLLLDKSVDAAPGAKMLFDALKAVAGSSLRSMAPVQERTSLDILQCSFHGTNSVDEGPLQQDMSRSQVSTHDQQVSVQANSRTERPVQQDASRSQVSTADHRVSVHADSRIYETTAGSVEVPDVLFGDEEAMGFDFRGMMEDEEQVCSEEDEDPLPMLPCL